MLRNFNDSEREKNIQRNRLLLFFMKNSEKKFKYKSNSSINSQQT